MKNVHGGAVVAMHIDLLAEDIERLTADGIDGFEIANFGHPELSESTRAALLGAQTTHRIALLANSDWHGWGGFARTWTVVKPAHAAGSRAEQVIAALRDRDPERIVPIVSQVIGAPSVLRGIFAPVAEIVRYATELTPARLVSWWAWTIVLVWLAARLRRAQVSPGRCFLGLGLVVLGVPISLRAAQLAIAWLSGAPQSFRCWLRPWAAARASSPWQSQPSSRARSSASAADAGARSRGTLPMSARGRTVASLTHGYRRHAPL